MKITFVLPGYPWRPRGGTKVVYEYANHLVSRGHTVSIVHPRYMRNWLQIMNYGSWWLRQAVRIFSCFYHPEINWMKIDKRVQMLWVPEPTVKYIPDADAVFATYWITADYVIDYPKTKGVKYYLVQDFYPYLGNKTKIEATWRYPLKKVAISKWIGELMVTAGISKKEIRVIPNGIDLQRFRLLNAIDERPKNIAMMYNKLSYKAPEDGIKALEKVKRKYKDITAVCFGPSKRPRRLPDWIKYYSKVGEEELVEIYNSSSIFISSSLVEGFALPPAEAMACGCAVAATDSGGIQEYAENEVNALLSKPSDVETLAQNIIRLIEDDVLRIRLAKKGYELIQAFTWEKSTSLLEQFMSEK